jgi:hypothetical protein
MEPHGAAPSFAGRTMGESTFLRLEVTPGAGTSVSATDSEGRRAAGGGTGACGSLSVARRPRILRVAGSGSPLCAFSSCCRRSKRQNRPEGLPASDRVVLPCHCWHATRTLSDAMRPDPCGPGPESSPQSARLIVLGRWAQGPGRLGGTLGTGDAA